MDVKLVLLQILTAALSSVGFSILYKLHTVHIPFAALGGALVWTIYVFMFRFTDNVFVSSLVAAMFATLYAEVFAKLSRTPATVLLIPSVIPLIPGSSLYYTMSGFVSRDMEAVSYYGKLTALYALSLALGIAVVWTVWATLFQRKPSAKAKADIIKDQKR